MLALNSLDGLEVASHNTLCVVPFCKWFDDNVHFMSKVDSSEAQIIYYHYYTFR